jgi:hypothetical protein
MPTTPATPTTPGTTNTQGLADWAAPYITNYLGQAQALAQEPYQAYEGPLTAGPSTLQNQAFTGIGSLTVPAGIGQAATTAGDFATRAGNTQYTAVGSDFGTQQAQQYMNPYLQAALNPAMEEARRQADISRMADAGRLTQAGAFGGGRQAIMESEGRRNLMDKQNQMLTSGYASAFDKAQQQFNADQARKINEQQFGAELGLKGLQTGIQGAQTQGQLAEAQNKATLANLQQQLAGGEIQRGITSEGVKADLDEFNRQRDDPYKRLQFQREMISGLPVGSVTSQSQGLSGVAALIQGMGGAAALNTSLSDKESPLYKLLGNLGINLGD